MPVAIVTGAARDRGIGRGIVLALAERGFDVAVNDAAHDEEAARRVAEVEALGRRAIYVRADVSRPDENERLVAETVERLGRLDVFVANAGVARWQMLVDVTPDDWDLVMGVNLHGAFYGCRAAASEMRRQGDGGNIVVTSSVNAVMPFSPLGLYGASKHAVGLLVGVMAREWGEVPAYRRSLAETLGEQRGAAFIADIERRAGELHDGARRLFANWLDLARV